MNQFYLSATKRALLNTTGIIIGASLFIPAMSVHAEEVKLDLDAVEVVDERNSDTQPVIGYKADDTSSATRTDTPLKEVPQSITVITKDTVKDISIQSLTQAVEYVPGVQGAQGEGNRDAIIFRGNQSTSNFFADGVRDDVQIYRDLYNTENLEILKGPNAIASGRGGAGGIINRVTKDAGWDPIRELRISAGSYSHKRTQIDIGNAINDVAAFRLNAVFEDSDSYRDGVDVKRYGIAPTVTIKPSDATKIRLKYEYFKDERIGDRGFPSVQANPNGDDSIKNLGNRPYNLGDYDQFFGNAKLSPNESEVNAFSAFIEHDFDNGFTIKNSTRYADYDKFYQNIYPGTAIKADGSLGLSSYRDETDRENFTNQTDLIYTLDAGAVEHKLLASLEITEQDNKNRRIYPEDAKTTVNVSNPTAVLGPFTEVLRNHDVEVSVLGITLQDQIKYNKWVATIGVRYDDVKTKFHDIANEVPEETINDDLWSPRVGLTYNSTDAVSVYGSYSVGRTLRAGDQLVSLRGNIGQAQLEPEKFINKEIGAKWDITPKLRLDAAIYELERENVITATIDDESILTDAQKTTGFELGLTGKMTSNWDLMAALTIQDGRLTKAVGSSPDGAQLANTPDRSLSVWNKYQINDVWSVALGIVSVSNRLAALETNTATSIMPGYTRYDAAVFADFTDNLRLQLNIENLTDKEYAIFGHNRNNIMPGAPINGRATLIYNF